MKKLLTFLMMSVLAIGVGWAEETVTLTQSNLEITGSSYSSGTRTLDGITYVYTDMMKNNSDIQVKATTGEIHNTTAFSGNITSVAITHSGTARATTISGSSDGTNWTQVVTGSGSVTGNFSGKGYKYFKITRGSNAAYWTKIVITYEDGGSSVETVATPTFSPAAGTYYEPQNVTLSCSTIGAAIRYTTDGTEPSATTGAVYTGPVTISSTTTIKAIATANGYDPSSIATATYIISDPPEVLLNYSNTLLNGHENFYVVDRAMGGLSKVWKDSQYGITANGLNRTSEVESYLYSPVFDATSMGGYTISLDFEENVRFFATDALSASQATLWVREGTTGDWQQLTITPTHANADNNDFHGINTIDLSPYAGKKFQLAFKYLADMDNDPGRWEVKNFSITATKAASSDLYILGMINGNGEYPTRAVKMGYDGNNYTAKIWVIGNSNNAMGVPGSWMAFTTVLAENNDDGGWGYVNGNRYSPSPNEGDYYPLTNGTESDIPLIKQNNDKAFLIPAGLYEVSVSGDLSKFSLNTIKDLKPTITPNGGEVNQYSTAAISISEDFNAFIDDCNEVVYADGTVVNDITAPVAKFYLNNELVNGTSTNYQFSTVGPVTLTSKCTLEAGGSEYATKTATANFTVNEVTLGDDEYILVTSANDLEEGGQYIIVARAGANASGDAYGNYILSTDDQTPNTRKALEDVVLLDNNTKSTTTSTTSVLTLEGSAGKWKFNSNAGYLYLNSNNNYLLVGNPSTATNAETSITINGTATIVFNDFPNGTNTQSSNTRYLQFNPNFTSHEITNPRFACYASSQVPVYLYKKAISTPPSNQVATPIINPGSGESSSPYTVYGGKQEIAITCATDGATIYYTIDGSEPTTSSTQYTVPFDLESTGGNKTVKAIAIKDGLDNSAVATSYYLFKSPNGPTFNPASGTVRNEAFDVTIISEYDDAEIYYMLDPEGDEVPTATMLYTSDNLYSGPVNVSGEGSHIIYALVERNGIKSSVVNATYTITSGGQPADEGDYVKVTSSADLADGEYLIVYEEGSLAFNGGLETLDASGNSIGVSIINDMIKGSSAVDAANFTIDVTAGTIKSSSGYYIGQTTDGNGLKSSVEEAYTNTISIDADGNAVILSSGGAYLRYNSDSGQERFRYFKSSTYTGQKAIQLYKKIPPEPVVLEGVAFTAERQWATWFGDANLALPEGVTAYVVTGVQGEAVAVEALDYIPANTGVLLNRETAAESVSAMPYTGEAGTIPTNLLVGSLEAQPVSNAYLLYNNQFILAQDGTTVGAHRCYLPASASTQGAPRLLIGDPGTITGIETINTNGNGDNTYYNLMGQPVANPAPGIYIRGGKKVIIK